MRPSVDIFKEPGAEHGQILASLAVALCSPRLRLQSKIPESAPSCYVNKQAKIGDIVVAMIRVYTGHQINAVVTAARGPVRGAAAARRRAGTASNIEAGMALWIGIRPFLKKPNICL
jgi:hypothetical protein